MIYIVTGFGRCGTSLMMQCFEASGIEPYYDKLLERSLLQNNKPGYLVNKAFMECNSEDYMKLGFGRTIPDGRVAKIALRGIPLLSGGIGYKIVMMDRKPESIRESFIKSGLVPDFDKQFPSWPNFYYRVKEEIEALLNVRKDVDYIRIKYEDLMKDTKAQFRRIQAIAPLDMDKSVAIVDPGMQRH